MLRAISIASILAAAVLAVACDPYAPDLGDKPYRCATSEPKCPDGYDAVDVGQPNLCECQKPGSDPTPQPDAMPSQECSDDNTEPNDLISNARNTPLGTGAQAIDFNQQAICTQLDIDTYKVTVTQANQKVKASLKFNAGAGALIVHVVNQTNTIIDSAPPMPVGGMLVVQATIPNPGPYFVQVGSSSGVNVYDLKLELLQP
jgi:hypothetical protein